MSANMLRKKPTKEQFLQSSLTTRLTPQRFMCQPRHIQQNNFYRRTVMLKNFPSGINRYCALSTLSQVKNTTFSLRGTPLPETQAATLINNQINNRKSVFSRTKKATDRMDAETEQTNIEKFYEQLQESQHRIYDTNIFIEMYGKTEKELGDIELKVRNILSANKITYESLRYEQKEGFMSVFPLFKDQFVKSANNFPTNTLAALYPFSFSNRNDDNGLLLGETVNGGYIFLDLDLRDDNIMTGNYAIIGKSGQGKTWLQKKIASQEIFKGTTVFSFDPDRDYVEMFHRLGGTNINCADGKVKINPFEVRRLRDDEIERELLRDTLAKGMPAEESVHAFTQENIFFQHLSWLREFFGVLFPDITQQQVNALGILTQDMYAAHHINEHTDFSIMNSMDYPVFSDLYEYIRQVHDQYNTYHSRYDMISPDMLRELMLLLYDCHGGSLGYLLNGHTNIQNSRIINFDLHELLTGSSARLQAVIFNAITYVWNRIALREESVLFFVDELSLLLNRKNPIIVNYLRDFAKRIRKYGSKLGTATQNLDDYNDPDIRHLTKPIFANTDFKFLFYPDHFDLKTVQEMLKLTDGEIACISKPRRGHCLLKAGDDRYYFKVGELPYEKELFGKLSG